MRRFLTLVFMLCLAIPAGITISGCTRNPAGNYCYGLAYGLKNTDVASITLQPQTTGISLAFGQTQQVQQPSALTCTGSGASVNSNQYNYGTTNNKLVDISPTGQICAGTWNRNTGGGIPDYTYCNFPNPLPSTNGLPYGVAYITASAESVTSNPVKVFIHAQVSSVALVGPQQCLSQTQTANLDAQACFSSNGQQYLMCAPSSVTTSASPNLACPVPPGQTLASIPSCTASIGYFNFSVGNSTVATLNTNANQITANAPGTTAINASIAGSGSSAGYFSTCPPQSISVTLADGTTKGTVTKGVTQNLTTKVVDTNNQSITGLTLDYQSTNPIDITVSGSGSVTSRNPGVASVFAICQPVACNPAPINQLGFNGTGLSISSNPVNLTTPGTISDYVWFASPGQSQYFVSIELLTGTVGSTVRLPYVPNSMVMDRDGSTLYFGSARELMAYSTISNSISKQDTNAPGVVLAVAPNNSQVLINDQVRQLFYLYNSASGSSTTFGGLGNAAAWSPDSKTLYITDNAALNSMPTGDHRAHRHALCVQPVHGLEHVPASAEPTAVLGPFLRRTLRPSGRHQHHEQTPASDDSRRRRILCGAHRLSRTPGAPPARWATSAEHDHSTPALSAGRMPSPGVQSDVLTATTDGKHILGAALLGGGITLSDIADYGSQYRVSILHHRGTTQTFAACRSSSSVNQLSLARHQ